MRPERGPKGAEGPTGHTGDTGATGAKGATGAAGENVVLGDPLKDLRHLMYMFIVAVLVGGGWTTWMSYRNSAQLGQSQRSDCRAGLVDRQNDIVSVRALIKANMIVANDPNQPLVSRRARVEQIAADRRVLMGKLRRIPPGFSCEEANPNPGILPW